MYVVIKVKVVVNLVKVDVYHATYRVYPSPTESSYVTARFYLLVTICNFGTVCIDCELYQT